jgi:transposase
MPEPTGNQHIKGNKRGRPSKYKSEFAQIAEKLCAKCGLTDAQLADWFEVSLRTINDWKLRYPEFAQALRAGKADFLRFLDQMDEEQKLLKAEQARLIERQQIEPVQPSTDKSGPKS